MAAPVPGGTSGVFSMDQYIKLVEAKFKDVEAQQKAMQDAATKSGGGGLNIVAMMKLQQSMNILEMGANLGSTMMGAASNMATQITRKIGGQ
jgi:cyclopropane fatty-acyl-phospholipid synthase-like methyltransferase